MNLEALIASTRRALNDPDGSIFTQTDIEYYINEAIERFKIHIYFVNEISLDELTDEPEIIPSQYHHLLGVYSSARLFGQDERHYQSTSFMNEFEVKLEELLTKIESGELTIYDSEGEEITADYDEDVVTEAYFTTSESEDLEVIPDP